MACPDEACGRFAALSSSGPKRLRNPLFPMCYGTEFIATAVQVWLAQIGVKTLYIAPGSPWENGYNESFMYGRPLRCKVNRAGRAALGSGAFMYAACSCGLVL